MKKINGIYTPSFGVKIKTESVLETTSCVIFHNTGTDGFKDVYNALGNTKFPGNIGYYKLTRAIAQRIIKTYPEIAKATNEIKVIRNNNTQITKAELEQKIKPILENFGETIDITI